MDSESEDEKPRPALSGSESQSGSKSESDSDPPPRKGQQARKKGWSLVLFSFYSYMLALGGAGVASIWAIFVKNTSQERCRGLPSNFIQMFTLSEG